MNLRQIEAFQAVMEAGSITGAARILNISQPSVSKTIQHMELQLGMKLFKRSSGRVIPTPEAHALYTEVKSVYEKLRSIERIATDMRDGRAGRLSIATTPALGLHFIPGVLAEFQTRHRNASFSLLIRHGDFLEELVASQQVDLGIAPFPVGSAIVNTRKIDQGGMVCVVSPDHPLGQKKVITPEDLYDYPYVSFIRNQPFANMAESFFRSSPNTKQPSSQISVELCSTACSLVRCNSGFSIVDEFTAPAFPDLQAIILDPPVTFSVSLLQSQHRTMSIIARNFISHLEDAFKNRVRNSRIGGRI